MLCENFYVNIATTTISTIINAYLGKESKKTVLIIEDPESLYRAFRYHIQQLTLYDSYNWKASEGMKLLEFQPNDYQKNYDLLFTWALEVSMYYAESHQRLYPAQGNVFQRDILLEFQANQRWFFYTFMHHNALQIQDKIMNIDNKDYKSTYIQIKQNENLYFDTDPQPMALLTMIDSIAQSLYNIWPSCDGLEPVEKSDFMNYVNWYVTQVTGIVSSDSINQTKIGQLSRTSLFNEKYSEFFAASEKKKVRFLETSTQPENEKVKSSSPPTTSPSKSTSGEKGKKIISNDSTLKKTEINKSQRNSKKK